MVMDLNPGNDQVTDIFLVTNPDKLAGVRMEDAEAGQDANPGPEELP
jgi:hypothetical protein